MVRAYHLLRAAFVLWKREQKYDTLETETWEQI